MEERDSRGQGDLEKYDKKFRTAGIHENESVEITCRESFESESKQNRLNGKTGKRGLVQYSEANTRIGAKLLNKGNEKLLARRGGGEAGNTGGVAFRVDAVGAPSPLLRARAVLQNDGNTHVTVGRTTPGPMYEIKERPRS
jgi:hypothetical protein